MGLFDSLLNIGGGLLGQSIGQANALELQDHGAWLNYKYGRKFAENQYQWTRTGLEKANYNPYLMSGVSPTPAGNITGSGTPGQVDLSKSLSNATEQSMFNTQQEQVKAQTMNTNADTVLKNNQSITELYTQLEKINHADLMQAEKTLRDKDVSWYDKIQARENLRVANEIERTANDYKIGIRQAIAQHIGANAQMINANANDYYQRHRALGFSESKSENKSAGFTVPFKGGSGNMSRGKTYSRSW